MGFRDWFRRKPAPAPVAPRKRYAFAGAQQNRLLEDWVATWMSPKDELRWELQLLRNRAREQARNNPLARRYFALVDENVLGPEGISLQCKYVLRSGEPDEETCAQVERAWSDWCRLGHCTADGGQSWRDFTGAVLEAVARDGDGVVELLPGFGNDHGFAVQFHEGDLIDHEYNVDALPGGASIAMGIERDRWRRIVAVHVLTRHPADGAVLASGRRERRRIAAERALYLGRPRRHGSPRAEPWLTPVLVPMRMLDEYQNAELVAARAAAETPAFITKNLEATGPDPNDPLAGERILDTAKGTLQELGPGEGLATWPSDHPHQNVDPFLKAMQRQIAVGLGVSYAALTGDLSGANYSSMRVGSLQERDNWRVLQRWFSQALHQRVFAAWLKQAVIWQRVRLPGPLAEYVDVCWEARGWPWVDPKSDLEAAQLEVSMGLTSLTRLAADRGRDLPEVLAERKRELALAESLGVPVGGMASAAPVAAPDSPGEAEDTTADDVEDTTEDPAEERQIVVNVTTPPVNVTVERQGPEAVHVAAPVVTVERQEAPVVHVAPAEVSVTVEAAKPGKRTVRHVRDAAGKIVASEVEEVPNG